MPSTLDIVLLPGLDGTGRLFKPFVEALPPHLKPSVVSYPTDTPQSYADLEAFVGRLLPKNRPFAIVAESFSGPVAIRIAAKKPKGLMALVLACSFVRHPIRAVPRWTTPLIRGYLFRVSPPAWTIRKFLAGPDAPQELVSEVLTALRLVDPRAWRPEFGRRCP